MLKIKNQELRILFFGDVVGRPGRKALAKVMPGIKRKYNPDLVIANVENSAHGKGVTENVLNEIKDSGVDIFTSGEHIYDKIVEGNEEILFKNFPTLLKPANFLPAGRQVLQDRGEVLVETAKGKVLVVNLIGQVFIRFENLSPWTMLDEILERYENEDLSAIIVDFHAEATSEKAAFGQHFDGKISALLGTHTHVPTADAQILSRGTAYVTDVGMNGPTPSVLGMKSEVSIQRFLTGEMLPYEIAETEQAAVNYVIIDIDPTSKKAVNIKHEHKIINI